MRSRSSSNFPVVSSNPSTSNPKRHNRRRSKQPFILEESPVDTMADQRTMAELLRAPTEGYAEVIMVPLILAEQFELKHSLINMMTTDQFFGLEKDNPHDHICWFNKISSTIKYKDVPNSAIKLMLFPFSLAGAAHRWLKKEPLRSIHTWEDIVSKFINEFFPPQEQQIFVMKSQIFNNGGNLLERRTQDVLTIIENKSKCLAADGNTFPELRDNIQGYVSAVAVNYNQGNPGYRPPGSGSLLSNTVANPKGELKAITTRSEETFTNPDLAEYTIKVPPPPIQKYKPPSQRDYVVHPREPFHPNIPYPSRMFKQKQQEKDEKTLKALLSNKEKLQELANTPLNENCSAVILKKLPEKLRDPGKFLILCGFSKLKCKALADLGASINLMPLYVWKKLGLPELISTCMTLELANRAICTPARIARDIFVPVGKFTFPANFVIVDYESDPRVPLILGRPFLRTARALIDVHGEEMILRDGDERLILNIRHDTASYSNQPQRESINLINVFNNSSKDFLEDLFTNQPSGNPTFSSHPELTLPKVNYDIFDSEGGNVLSEKLLDLDSTNDLHPPIHDDPLSGNPTYSFSSNPLLEEFADELALITFPLKYNDDLQFDIESDLKEIEFLLHQDINSNLKDSIDLADIFVDSVPGMFTDKHALDYSSPPIFDEYDDDFLEIESDAENVYDGPFDSKGEKIKESKLLIDELDLPCDFLPFEYDSFISQDFSRVDALPSTNNEDNIFNPCILIQEKSFEIITRVVQDKKLATFNASSMLEDFDPPFYEPLFFKEVSRSKMLLLFSSENEEKVIKPGIHTSRKVYSSCIPKISHQGYKIFKFNQVFKSLMKIFLFASGKDTHTLAVPCLHFYPLDQLKYGGNWVKLSDLKQAFHGRHPMLILSFFSNE
uniref:Retrotransposon gag domain-containing protein n=1 Tax=Tanacetum cinerariifolium TaxID=118510 RepID=A0A699HAW9_TANCI|nr:hypothetical protein [Tanacetum cinerariifolium]